MISNIAYLRIKPLATMRIRFLSKIRMLQLFKQNKNFKNFNRKKLKVELNAAMIDFESIRSSTTMKPNDSATFFRNGKWSIYFYLFLWNFQFFRVKTYLSVFCQKWPLWSLLPHLTRFHIQVFFLTNSIRISNLGLNGHKLRSPRTRLSHSDPT